LFVGVWVRGATHPARMRDPARTRRGNHRDERGRNAVNPRPRVKHAGSCVKGLGFYLPKSVPWRGLRGNPTAAFTARGERR
jgi:hypothetical protein